MLGYFEVKIEVSSAVKYIMDDLIFRRQNNAIEECKSAFF